jgi:4-amino-4-deoxy-L-arabinose transferase-like glycosyltransferase
MKNKNTFLLLFILLLAAVLRFWNFSELTFTYDELNAMGRTMFPDFKQTWNYGIKVDAHPPLVQLWLTYYQKIFSDSEPLMKLPFILCGIGSIFLSYKISKKWFNETTALLTATLIATIQYTVMYSQIARPYSSGMFFCLLATWHWWNWLEAGKTKNYIFYIVVSALCAWNHYFSFFFAAMLGITGFFFVKKDALKKYLFAGLLILLLCLPAWQIFAFQLTNGNIGGWLGEPPSNFYYSFLKYIFHFSFIFYGIIGAILLFGFVTSGKKIIQEKNKLRVVCFLWALIPFAVAFIY